MAKDINKDKFPEETKLKLEIFAECFREVKIVTIAILSKKDGKQIYFAFNEKQTGKGKKLKEITDNAK
ncbi:MAG: hypothetical protein LBS46_05995 [Dysgonamonadaceae bacterium]|jgi:hypothetical protein|nr:hypothetical protein [Dysgonamonadaceae bacterium]